jgi:hypothetical protein
MLKLYWLQVAHFSVNSTAFFPFHCQNIFVSGKLTELVFGGQIVHQWYNNISENQTLC